MEDVAMLLDCKDILIEGSRKDSLLKRLAYSNKMKHAAMRGLSCTTPCGRFYLVSDLFLAGVGEERIVKLYAKQFGLRLPAALAILGDRGFSKIRQLLPNLNFVYYPAFLRASERGAEQFTAAETTVSRTRAKLRYCIETAYSRISAWSYLADRVDYEKLSLANEVWHWAHGFSNMFQAPLQEFGGEDSSD